MVWRWGFQTNLGLLFKNALPPYPPVRFPFLRRSSEDARDNKRRCESNLATKGINRKACERSRSESSNSYKCRVFVAVLKSFIHDHELSQTRVSSRLDFLLPFCYAFPKFPSNDMRILFNEKREMSTLPWGALPPFESPEEKKTHLLINEIRTPAFPSATGIAIYW